MTELRLLQPDDVPALRALLLQEPLYNLFMLGNLESPGFGSKDLVYWGHFRGQEMLGAAMRYRVNWCFHRSHEAGVDPGWAAACARLVDECPHSRVLNGHPALVEPVLEALTVYRVAEQHPSYFCRLPLDAAPPLPTHSARRAGEADIPALVEFYVGAGQLQRTAEMLQRTLQSQRIVVVEEGGRLVSGALTTVETPTLAMIGGVWTPEPLRGRGYASAAMALLCRELVAEGKQPCLFYDNPAAGTIYRRLGFQDIGPWLMASLARD